MDVTNINQGIQMSKRATPTFFTHRDWKRKCKNYIIVVTTDCKKGEAIMIKRNYCPEAPFNHRAQLKQKYGNKLVEIINDRYL